MSRLIIECPGDSQGDGRHTGLRLPAVPEGTVVLFRAMAQDNRNASTGNETVKTASEIPHLYVRNMLAQLTGEDPVDAEPTPDPEAESPLAGRT